MVVAAILMMGTIAGIMMASFMDTSGGAWDNTKKFIEDGTFLSIHGKVLSKGTRTHRSAVVGDTVGDPLKDCADPSLHVLVKLIATVSLVMSPLFV